MTLQEKMRHILSLDENAKVLFSPYTNSFYVGEEFIEVHKDSMLYSPTLHQPTPNEAVEAFFEALTTLPSDQYIVVHIKNDAGIYERHEFDWTGQEFIER